MSTDFGHIIKREVDGSYIINNGLYHVPNNEEFVILFSDVDAYAKANPDKVTIESKPADPTLDELKGRKLAEVKSSFGAYVSGYFTTCSLGYDMQFNESDSLKMQGSITLMEATGATEGYLTDAHDATHYNVPIASIKTVLLEMLARYAAAHAHKQELRASVEACTTQAELDAVAITWPE